MNPKKYFVIILTITLIFFSACNKPLEDVPIESLPNGNIHLKNLTNKILPSDAEEVLISFFKSYYESLANLEEKDMTFLFNTNNLESLENANINQGVLHYLVNHRGLQSNDLTINSYIININIDSINMNNKNNLEISLQEHSNINFNFIPNINSYTSSIQQNFILNSYSDEWKIQNYNRDEDINYLINDLYLEAKKDENFSEDNSKEVINNITNNLLKQSERNQNIISMAEKIKTIPNKDWDNDYNRIDAVAYANQWVSPNSILRNPNWLIYDNYGGNCANYTSQCLFAGGIPTDHFGQPGAQWKWYSDYIIGREVPQGRAPAWTGVNEFYDYSLINSEFGLVSLVDDNYFNGEIGDLIIFGTDLRWKHAVIITDVIKDENKTVIDYLINSNTTDRINYPVSAYSYSKTQLIKILGWNN